MDAKSRQTWKTLLAFTIIYLVWGSTYLAIRIGVHEVPPFLLAAIRFQVAGLALYGWMLARGERFTGRPPMGFGIPPCDLDLRPRLRVVVLGGTACAIRYRCGHDGHNSSVHGVVGNHCS